MDEDVASAEPEQRAEREPDDRLTPREERRADQELRERRVGVALDRRGRTRRGCPRCAAGSGRCANGQRNGGTVLDVEPVPSTFRSSPRVAAERLDRLPDDDDRERRRGRRRPRHASRRSATVAAAAADAGPGRLREQVGSRPVVAMRLSRSPPGRRCRGRRSMISKPSASCSSVMHSGGLVWIELFGDHRVQAVLAEVLPDRLHLVRGAVEGRQRRPRVARSGRGR